MSGALLSLECFDGHDAAQIRGRSHEDEETMRLAAARLAEETRAKEAAAATRHAELVRALTDIAAAHDRARQGALEQLAELVSAAVHAVLPCLLQDGATEEIAASIVEISAEQAGQRLTLRVPSELHDSVAEALKALAPDCTIDVLSDAALQGGKAQLSWQDGGADFDPARQIARARDLLAQRIDQIKERRASDE